MNPSVKSIEDLLGLPCPMIKWTCKSQGEFHLWSTSYGEFHMDINNSMKRYVWRLWSTGSRGRMLGQGLEKTLPEAKAQVRAALVKRLS